MAGDLVFEFLTVTGATHTERITTSTTLYAENFCLFTTHRSERCSDDDNNMLAFDGLNSTLVSNQTSHGHSHKAIAKWEKNASNYLLAV